MTCPSVPAPAGRAAPAPAGLAVPAAVPTAVPTAAASPSSRPAPPTGRTTDVLVVGGGIVGLACAWAAARAGATVTVLDPDPGDGATHAAAGMLAPVGEAEPDDAAAAALHLAAAALWPAFARDLEAASGLATGFEETGTLLVAYDAGDRDDLRRRLAWHRTLGLRSHELTPADARRLEPDLGPVLAGAALAPGDHRADPRATHRALLAALGAATRPARSAAPDERAGGRVRPEADAWERPGADDGRVRLVPRAAARLLRDTPGRVTGAVDDDGTEHRAGLTVLAAGGASVGLAARDAGLRVPVRGVVGQTVRLEAGAGVALARTVRGTVQGRPVYVVPRAARPDGTREVVVGATSEETADDRRPRAGGTFALLRDARALVPALDETVLVEATQRARPTTPDGRPLVGPSGVPGLWLATGHGRGGVLLAPLTGLALVAELTGAAPDAPLAAPAGPGLSTALAAADPARLVRPAALDPAPSRTVPSPARRPA